jgi:hypothetical protein
MKNLLIYILVLTFSLQTIAAVKQKPSISSVMIKYDYLLTAHPQAHVEEFKTKNLEQFKEELSSLTNSMTKSQLASQLEVLLEKVPTKKEREAFRKVLESSTASELNKFLANPKLFSAALQGEGANFAMNWEENGAIYGLLILMAVGVVFLILDTIKHMKYEFFTARSSYGLACSDLSSFEKNELDRRALRDCRDNALYPETCEQSDFGGRTYRQDYDDGTYYEEPYCESEYRAKRKLD